ncbi:helix-turn-helix domain-containing protein [Peptoniphilus catoniae]|uniref:helix-turn-helix domain-containing protein n=1 Tax=Peptoniphilus catoniae TaxID=1660341 RepID=UPI0010FE06E9|nr:XRE family transcriptional regulator [Peptoniphilus catoniae]
MDIGKKLKNLRVKNYLTQEELADRSELTKGFISQVERNLTSPSVATLIDILEALGTSPDDFFKESEEKIIFKDDDYFKSEKSKGYKVSWIVPNAQKNQMEPTILELESGVSTREIQPFPGEILGYVLDGKIELTYGDDIFEVNKNETFYFAADKASKIKNLRKKSARVMLISSPPNF